MKNNEIEKALKEKPMSFTLKEIEQIMDDELSKNPEEMNIELIDLCAVLIEKIINKSESKKGKRIKFNKFAVCAAIIAVILSIAMPITADYIKNGTKGKIITEYENNYEINLNNANDNAKKYSSDEFSIIKDFENIGLNNIVLPQAMLKKNGCTFNNLIPSKEEDLLNARVDFSYNSDINGVIYVFRGYTDEKTYNLAIVKVTGTADCIKIINNNGMDILVESNRQKSHIFYKDNNTVYHIHLENCSFDDAINIACSIE